MDGKEDTPITTPDLAKKYFSIGLSISMHIHIFIYIDIDICMELCEYSAGATTSHFSLDLIFLLFLIGSSLKRHRY